MKTKKNNPLIYSNNDELELIGRKICEELLDNTAEHKNILKIFLTKNNLKLIEKCQKLNLHFEIVNIGWFNKKFNNINHQNCAIFLKRKKTLNFNELIEKIKIMPTALILILDHIQDDYNFGAILRTAAALNVTAVIVPHDRQSKINGTVIKTSAGAALNIDIISIANLSQAIEKLKKSNCWIYATSCDEKAQRISTINFDSKSVLVLGNEGYGISKIIMKEADFHIKIAINSKVESLNVSHAGAILMYEISKKLNLIS